MGNSRVYSLGLMMLIKRFYKKSLKKVLTFLLSLCYYNNVKIKKGRNEEMKKLHVKIDNVFKSIEDLRFKDFRKINGQMLSIWEKKANKFVFWGLAESDHVEAYLSEANR